MARASASSQFCLKAVIEMHEDDLDRLEQDALRVLKMKTEQAQKGHDWVVDSHSLSSSRLLELVALAKLGYPIWRDMKR